MKFLFLHFLTALSFIFLSNSTAAQTITTYAGTGVEGYTGDGGLATHATFSNPFGVAFGKDNNLYIVDNSNNRIRKIDVATKIITTVVGLGSNGGNCPLSQAGLLNPRGIAFDKAGNMYISDASTCIRKVDFAAQTITTIAGTRGVTSYYGVGLGDNGQALDAHFDGIAGIAIDNAGNIFVADMLNQRIRKIDITTGIITTFAGGANFDAGDGHLATEAALNMPLAVAFDSKGDLYIADQGNHVIRKVDIHTNIISVVAGKLKTWGYSGDGSLAKDALINTPTGIAVDKDDNIYIADCLNNRVRKIDSKTGIISTIAGIGRQGYAGDCGPAKKALLNWPWSITFDKTGQIYFAELNNDVIRRILTVQNDFITGAESICLNDSVALTALEEGGSWTSSNPNIANVDSKGVIKGIAAGTAVISYSVNNAGCEIITASHNITVNPVNEVNANISSQNFCIGNKLTLNASRTGGKWYSNNSSVALIDTSGYLQCLNAGNAGLKYIVNASCSITDKVSLQIFKPKRLFLGNDTSICGNTLFKIDAGNSFIKYKWNTNDTTESIIIKSTGIYGLKATDTNNCIASDSMVVKTLDIPVINWPIDSSFCQGTGMILTTPPNITSSVWQDGSSSTFYTVTKTGSYWVTVTGENNCINADTIQINEITLPLFTLGADTTLCDTKTLSYEFNIPDVQYHWSDGSVSNKHVINKAGIYWLNINQNGCSSSDTINITYKPVPIVKIGNDTTLCENITKLLGVQIPNASFLWQDGSTDPNYLVYKPGQYYVTATLNNCSASDTIQITYRSIPYFTLGPDTFICKGSQLKLQPSVNTPSNYLWQDGSSASSFNVNEEGLYYLKVFNECGSFSDSIKIANNICNLNLPSAFTPNRDGLNDVFRVKYAFPVKDFNMVIYNRWGEKIFESHNMSQGWNGTYKGILASMDTYVWFISLIDENGRKETKYGSITLIR